MRTTLQGTPWCGSEVPHPGHDWSATFNSRLHRCPGWDAEARIPVHTGDQVVGYVRIEGDGRLRWEPEQPELPTPPFGGRRAYERVFDALRHVELVDPTRLEQAASAVMEALFGDHNSADQRYPRIELPWPTSAEQFEELLLRISLWSIVAHLVRDRDAEEQRREHLACMFPGDKVPPLLDHLDRTLRDGREMWRVCVEQEKILARVGEALDDTHPVAAVRAVREVLEAGRG